MSCIYHLSPTARAMGRYKAEILFWSTAKLFSTLSIFGGFRFHFCINLFFLKSHFAFPYSVSTIVLFFSVGLPACLATAALALIDALHHGLIAKKRTIHP